MVVKRDTQRPASIRGTPKTRPASNAHPYFMLLNAMGDGAALLDSGGAILFGNHRLERVAGAPGDALAGTPFHVLVAPSERASFDAFLSDGATRNVVREFSLVAQSGTTTPVAIALSTLALSPNGPAEPGDRRVLMAIITDLSERKAGEAARFALLERLMSAEDNERRRIARELHDETGQALTALLVGLRTIADTPAPRRVRSAAARLRAIVAQTMRDVGRLARGLHPAVLDDDGLAAAARRYVGDYTRSFGTPARFVAGDLDTPPLPPLAAATMYRILQEALTNVARHARATKIAVEATRIDGWLELFVQDDGVGFDERREQKRVTGLGLRGMRERVTLLGGSIDIQSKPARGTTVHARIPVERRPSLSYRPRS